MALGTALANRVPGARTRGVPVSGGVAFMVIGLAALVLAFSAFAIVLRRSAPRTSPSADSTRLTEATGLGVATGAAERDAGQLRDRAEADAEQLRNRAQADADQLRDRAQADAEQLRTRAEAEAEGIVKRAAEGAEQAALDRRQVEDEIRAVKDEMRELRSDLERRELRIGEREQRLDAEIRRMEERRQDLDERARALDDAAASTRQELERVAGLTADDARNELVATMENQAKREAAVTIRN